MKTNWIVITGAPSSGKTSVIEVLRAQGHTVVTEVARDIIQGHIGAGRSLEQIRARNAELQDEILKEKLVREAALDPRALVFLDRGMPDSLTYFRLAEVDPAPAREASLLRQYRAVFFFDRLPLEKDGVRWEEDAQAETLDRDMEADYRTVGYDPIRVPLMSIGERVDFVLRESGALAGKVAAASD